MVAATKQDLHGQAVWFLQTIVPRLNELLNLAAQEDDPDPALVPIIASLPAFGHAVHDLFHAIEDLAPLVKERRAAWEGFLGEHPELDGTVDLDVASIDDDAIVSAVEEAARRIDKRYAERGWPPWKHGVSTSDVARVLAGCGDEDVRLTRGDRIRVGQRLGKLTRAGRIVLAPEWGGRRYMSLAARTD